MIVFFVARTRGPLDEAWWSKVISRLEHPIFGGSNPPLSAHLASSLYVHLLNNISCRKSRGFTNGLIKPSCTKDPKDPCTVRAWANRIVHAPESGSPSVASSSQSEHQCSRWPAIYLPSTLNLNMIVIYIYEPQIDQLYYRLNDIAAILHGEPCEFQISTPTTAITTCSKLLPTSLQRASWVTWSNACFGHRNPTVPKVGVYKSMFFGRTSNIWA